MRVEIERGTPEEIAEFINEQRIFPKQIIAITPDGSSHETHVLWYIALR